MDYKEFTDLGQQAMLLTEGLIFSEEDYRSNVHKWIRGEDNILFIMGLSGSGKTTLGDELAEKYGCKVIHMDHFYHMRLQEDPSFKKNPNRNSILFDEAIREIGNDRGIIEGHIWDQIDKFRDRPIIMKKTSMVTSDWRQMKRTFQNSDQFKDWKTPYAGPFDHLKKMVRHTFGNMGRNVDIYKQLNSIEQDLSESTDTSNPLSKFKEIPLTTENVKKYKDKYDTEHLHRIRTYPDYKEYFGSIFIDADDHVVAYVNVNKNTGMIQALEVAKKYRGQGLSKPLLKYSEDKYGAVQLTTNKNNTIAQHVYSSSGWVNRGNIPGSKSDKVHWFTKDKSIEYNKPRNLTESADTRSKYRLYDSFDEFCENINTPEEMKNWFIKTKHKFGPPSHLKGITWPDDLVRGEESICFDHALFIYRWAKKKGWDAHILWFGGPTNDGYMGHLQPYFKYKGKYYLIDVQGDNNMECTGTYMKSYSISSFQDLKKLIDKEINKVREIGDWKEIAWNWYSEYDINKIFSYEGKKTSKIDDLIMSVASGIIPNLPDKSNPYSYSFFNNKIKIRLNPNIGYLLSNITKDPKTTLQSLYHKYFSESTTPLFDFTFYHGSPDKVVEFEPISPNMGNQLEPPKWVVYMFMNPNFAHIFALSRVIDRKLDAKYKSFIDFDPIKIYCLVDDYDKLKKELLNKNYYVYTLKVDPDTIGVGHTPYLDEYTSTDPHPRIMRVDEIKITKELIEKILEPIDSVAFEKMLKEGSHYRRPKFADLMFDEPKVFKTQKAIKLMIKQGSVDPRKDNIQDVVQHIESYQELFKQFKTIKDLAQWVWNNVVPLRPDKDTKFIWPEEVLKTKKAACMDIAVLFHTYCNINWTSHRFGQVGFAYTNDLHSKTINHQCHIVLLYKSKEENNIWCIVQNSGPDRLRKIIFKGNTDANDTLELFAKAYVPNLVKYIKERKPHMIIKENICKVCDVDAIGKFDREYFGKIDNKTHANKQAIINNMFEKKVT